jgi:outer membrane biosynthesis protein TonB
MAALAPYYRQFNLPWTPREADEQRFWRVLRVTLIIVVLLGILLPLLPLPESANKHQEVPERFAKLLIDHPKPPPPPPPPKPKEEPKPDLAKIDKTKPPDPSKKAQQAISRLKDELADLRDQFRPEDLAKTREVDIKDASSERSLITSKVGNASGGINTANLSRGYGGGAGALGTHDVARIGSPNGIDAGRGGAQRSGTGGKAARTREEIEMVFDQNKSAIYAIYNRALRDTPDLQGKIVLQLTIAPWGEVTDCRVISSELNDPELQRKLIARIKLFKFAEKDVEALTATKTIDFFPA